jgi:hypothetical protein
MEEMGPGGGGADAHVGDAGCRSLVTRRRCSNIQLREMDTRERLKRHLFDGVARFHTKKQGQFGQFA